MLKCRYSDCVEQHALAGDDDQVTCGRCRNVLGLPVLEPEFTRIRQADLSAMTDLLASAYATLEAITGAVSLHEAVGLAAGGLKPLRNWRVDGSALLNE